MPGELRGVSERRARGLRGARPGRPGPRLLRVAAGGLRDTRAVRGADARDGPSRRSLGRGECGCAVGATVGDYGVGVAVGGALGWILCGGRGGVSR